MLNTLNQRIRLARLLLAIAILVAVYIAIPKGDNDLHRIRNTGNLSGIAVWLIALVDELKRIEILHIVIHSAVFGGVAILLGDWGLGEERGSTQLSLRHVLAGTFLMELGQTIVGFRDDTVWSWLWGTGFDVFVNLTAAYFALWLLRHYQARFTHAATTLRLIR